MTNEELLTEVVERLHAALGDALVSVVLYGPETHGDRYRVVGDLNLMIVLSDVEPSVLGKMGPAMRWWARRKQPWPRLFSPASIRASLDVFPIDFLNIFEHHRTVYGDDPLADVALSRPLLRLHCERELREKLMRLEEGYVECHARNRQLRKLLVASYSSFSPVFRGCLHLAGASIPEHDRDVAAALARALDLDAKPFDEVERLATSGQSRDEKELFAAYYGQLARAIERIDRLEPRA